MKDQPVNHGEITTLVTRVECLAGCSREQFLADILTLFMAAARAPGFWSGEVMPAVDSANGEWLIVQRFASRDHSENWKNSEHRKQVYARVLNRVEGTSKAVEETIEAPENAYSATAITTEVKPDMQDDYFNWVDRIQLAQSRYAGYHGVYLQPPSPGRENQWATLVKFETPEDLERWFECDERRALLAEAEKFVKSTKFRPLSSSFPGWVPAGPDGKPPPNWKTACLVLLGLYPIVMIEILFVQPYLPPLNSALKSFILMMGSVAGTTFVTMPLLVKRFSFWLYPEASKSAEVTAKGIGVVCVIFALELLLFWNSIRP